MVLQETSIRLSKAVLFRDMFTGTPVSAEIRVHSLSGGTTEKKAGGYVLFLNVNSPEVEIEVESPVYQRRKLILKADGGKEVEEVLLYPSPAFPVKEGDTAVRGRARPGSLVRCYLEEEQRGCRLLQDYRQGEAEISFYLKRGIRSPFWHIRKRQEQTGEYFHMRYSEGDNEYFQLFQPLTGSWQKKDTILFPAQGAIADDRGEFYLLLGKLPQETGVLQYSCKFAEQEICGKAEIISGKENHILEE
ncbi:hypothetical protein VSQ32_04030 [Lachnospiraceae bacterium KK002]